MDDLISIEEFRRALARAGKDFLYTSGAADDHAQIRFLGIFEGREIIWDANIMTLERHNTRQRHAHQPTTTRQFIDVAANGATVRRIEIGLDIDRIDHPALLKTIIMVRQYRKLHTGRHEFRGAGRHAAT